MPPAARDRLLTTLAIAAAIALGLASRRWPWLLPAWLGKYPGDALWATMVFFCFAWVLPAASTLRLAALALGTSWLVEFSQLVRAPWLDAARDTTPGHLVLGSTFTWLDLPAYAAGVLLGAAADRLTPASRPAESPTEPTTETA
ncbi:MAG: DUF2809 domain-containing protein [Aquabacterium sp.]|nr:MAG: DUF2809 domain-containing protein [Aquabacterium sp.]